MKPTDEAPPVIFVDQLQSLNYAGPTPPDVFSVAGTRFDFDTGDIVTPGLFVDGVTGDVAVRGDVTATSMVASVRDGTLQLGDDIYGMKYAANVWTDPATTADLQFVATQNGVIVGGNVIYIDGSSVVGHAEALGHSADLALHANHVSFGDVVELAIDNGSGSSATLRGSVLGGVSTVDLIGDTVTLDAAVIEANGTVTIDAPAGLNNWLNLKDTSNPTSGRPYISIFGGSNGGRQLYIGFPNPANNENFMVSTGPLHLQGGGTGVTVSAASSGQTVELDTPTATVQGASIATWEIANYVPTLTSVTIGGVGGQNVAKYIWVGGHRAGQRGQLTISGYIELGNSPVGTVTGNPTVSLPTGFVSEFRVNTSNNRCGVVYMSAAGGNWIGHMFYNGTDRLGMIAMESETTPLRQHSISGTEPGGFWSVGNRIVYNVTIPAVRV